VLRSRPSSNNNHPRRPRRSKNRMSSRRLYRSLEVSSYWLWKYLNRQSSQLSRLLRRRRKRRRIRTRKMNLHKLLRRKRTNQ
jgi:hypothetical protein